MFVFREGGHGKLGCGMNHNIHGLCQIESLCQIACHQSEQSRPAPRQGNGGGVLAHDAHHIEPLRHKNRQKIPSDKTAGTSYEYAHFIVSGSRAATHQEFRRFSHGGQ